MRHAKAESLIETIVAITVIVIATAAALSILRTSVEGNELIGEKLVAMNLAEEAFEALRNMRDTNYLLFASNPDDCWNKLEVTDVDECSDGSVDEIKADRVYYLTRDFSSDPLFKWHLLEALDPTEEGYMDLYDIDLDGDGEGDMQLYAQSEITDVPSMSASTDHQHVYQRHIVVSDVVDNSYTATVYVYWMEKGQRRSLTLTRSISNVF